jgi:hypothetical protein
MSSVRTGKDLPFHRAVLIVLLLGLALATAGCIDFEEEFTLNPDGSGKVVVQWVYAPVEIKMDREQEPVHADEAVKKAARDELEKSEGVECWKDVSTKLRDDGKIAFKGTAYFRDLSKMKIHTQGVSAYLTSFSLSKDDRGNLVLIPVHEANEKKEPVPIPANEEEIKKRIRDERFGYQQIRPMTEALLNPMKVKVRVHLPGSVGATSCFKKGSDRSVEIVFDGKAALKVLDQAAMDDEFLRSRFKEGGGLVTGGPGFEEVFSERLFGEKGPIRAVTTGELKPFFDLEKEANEEVRKAYAKLCETLGVGAVAAAGANPAPPSAPAAPLFKNAESLLKAHITIDLGSPEVLGAPHVGDAGVFENLETLLQEGNYAYDLRMPGRGSSGGNSSGKRFLRLHLSGPGEALVVEEFEIRTPEGRLSLFRQTEPGSFELVVESEAHRKSALLVRRAGRGVSLALVRERSPFAKQWLTLDEALRGNPVEMGEVLSLLRALPVELAPTLADPEAIRLALGWRDGFPQDIRERMARWQEVLKEDDLAGRENAAKELKEWVAAGDPLRMRILLSVLEKTDNAEERGRLRDVADSQKRLAAIVELVRKGSLYRDLPFLGALLESGDFGAAARRLLAALVGREFATRAEFEAWHERAKPGLTWDERGEKYQPKE